MTPANEGWYLSQKYLYLDLEIKFDNDPNQQGINVPNFPIIYLDADTHLQYAAKGEECNYLIFMIPQDINYNSRYLVTKCLFDLTHDIYFLPFTDTNSHILNLNNKVIDGIMFDFLRYVKSKLKQQRRLA